LLRGLRARGVACVFISHKLDEVFAVADRITVLRDGVAQGTLAAATTDANEVIARMVGRRIEDYYPRRAARPGRRLLAVRGLEVADTAHTTTRLRGLDFDVHAGEVVGIGGLMGAGRTELLMHLLGLWGERRAGTVELDGRPFEARDPRDALRRGVALVSEDRKRFGLVPEQGVTFNLSLASLEKIRRGPLVDTTAELQRARTSATELRIRSSDLDQPVGTLSGGNQQKVVLGKVLLTEPTILLLDEPTRGIDVGARLEVYELINQLAASGKGIVLVSSELPELLGMSDRIVMLHDGRVGGVFDRAAATQEALLEAALGRFCRAA
jgi:D-xylose transport system ATP-binding protein